MTNEKKELIRHKLSVKKEFAGKDPTEIVLRQPTTSDIIDYGIPSGVNDFKIQARYIAALAVEPLEGLTEGMVRGLEIKDFMTLAMSVTRFLAGKMPEELSEELGA